MGRVGVDLYPRADRRRAAPTSRTFAQVARRQRDQRRRRGGAARRARGGHHRRSATTRSARTCATRCEGFGVDDRCVGTASDAAHAGRRSARSSRPTTSRCYFYREPKAPDMEIARRRARPRRDPRGAGVLDHRHRACRDEPSRAATLAALEARGRVAASPCSTSTTGRCSGPSREEARELGRAGARATSTVAVGNLDECDTAVGDARPARGGAALRERGVELAIVKQGPKGVLARDGDERRRGAAGAGRGRQRARRRRRVRRRAVPRAARGLGARARRCASATRRARSSPRGSRAPTRCPTSRGRRAARGGRDAAPGEAHCDYDAARSRPRAPAGPSAACASSSSPGRRARASTPATTS